MVPVDQLWMPVLLSAVFVFVASSVIHMALPVHKGDMQKLPDEDAVGEAMRKAGVKPGDYLLPCPGSMKEMGTPEFKARYERGPVAFMTVMPSATPAIGKSLLIWFVWSVIVSFFVGYLTGLACPAGTGYPEVFRVAGTVAILGYAFSNVTNSIWKGVAWSTTFKFVFDGVVYALVTAGTFGWLWPETVGPA
ncbi:MAG: hypothetical protein H6825_15515 [Planctomycetes bacterium]|nr:hypothetical protein [Planctomycetota bacterium]